MAISDLKGSINAKIKTNGSQSITGAVLNEVLNEMVDELDVASELKNKVDKEFGKGLSTNDFTTSEKEKLAGLENYDDAELRGEVESLQTEVDSHDVAIEDLQDNKVDKGDYAPALTAGFADNLVSKDVVVDSEFNLRRSGGGAISDGVARMEVVKGNSVVWNQRLNNAYQASGIGGWFVRQGQDKAEFSDNSVTWSFVSGVSSSPELTQLVGFTKGHKYLFVTEYNLNWVDGGNEFYLIVRQTAGPANNNLVNLGTIGTGANQGTASFFFESQYDDKPYLTFYPFNITNNIGESATLTKARTIDLTQMFGAGNEPTTIEEFYARKPIVEDEYAYNEGEVIHCNVDAVKSVGRNVWDEEWELGSLNATTGQNQNSNLFIRSKNFVKVMPNAQYHITTPNGKWIAFLEYDESCQFLRYRGSLRGNVTTSADCAYMRFYVADSYGVTYNHDICINLSDPDFNGQYEPYKEEVRELPSAIKEVFPNGMMSAGTAHDVAYNDLNKEVGVTEKRIGVVDMGTLNWGMISASDGNVLFRATLKDRADAVSDLLSAQCSKYIVVKQSKRTDKTISGAGSSVVDVIDSAYTDAASFKAAMAGVMLYYELATPIVTEHQEPFNLDYQVTNGGQEQAMATKPTSAFKAEIAYGFNASAKIKENANEIAQLKATIAQLQAALASMVNENVEDYE